MPSTAISYPAPHCSAANFNADNCSTVSPVRNAVLSKLSLNSAMLATEPNTVDTAPDTMSNADLIPVAMLPSFEQVAEKPVVASAIFIIWASYFSTSCAVLCVKSSNDFSASRSLSSMSAVDPVIGIWISLGLDILSAIVFIPFVRKCFPLRLSSLYQLGFHVRAIGEILYLERVLGNKTISDTRGYNCGLIPSRFKATPGHYTQLIQGIRSGVQADDSRVFVD